MSDKIRSLSVTEMGRLVDSICPVCNQTITTTTEQTEPYVITTTGHCDNCASTFMVDRSYPVPYEFLGGHQYYE